MNKPYTVIYDYDDGEYRYAMQESFATREEASDFIQASKNDPLLNNFETYSPEEMDY